jgi:undecaprenyl-diphosphatase
VHDGLPAPLERRLDPAQRYGLRLTLLGVALLLVAVPFGALLAQVITDGPAMRWDTAIAEELHRQVAGRDGLVALLQAISFLGKPIWLAVVIGAPALWLVRRGHRHLALFLVVTALSGGIIDTVVKHVVGRPRPVLDAPVATAFGNSFPSGHAMSATVCYGALLLAFGGALRPAARRTAIAVTVVLVLAIGATRLALGVHFVTDVLGGFVLGLAWLACSVAAWEIWREDRGLRRSAPLDEGVEPEDVPHPTDEGVAAR